MDNKKAVAAAVAAVISASGAAVDASFDNPADILQNTNVEPKVAYADPTIDTDDATVQDEKKETQGVRGTFREWILKLPVGVRAIFVVPAWAVGSVVLAGGEFLFAGLTPLLHGFLTFAVMALVIMGAFTVTAKAMFPDLPLKKILNRHTFKWLILVSIGAFVADLLLSMFWVEYSHFKTFIQAGLVLLALGTVVAWFARREHRRRAKLAAAEKAKAEAEQPKELVVKSLGETFTIRIPKEEAK